MEPRTQLKWFANKMEDVLSANDHKGGWSDVDIVELLENAEIAWQKMELEIGRAREGSGDFIIRRNMAIKKCCDVANFMMMIANNIQDEIVLREQVQKGVEEGP